MQHVLPTSTSTRCYCNDTSHSTRIQAYTHTEMLQIKLKLKPALLPDASMQIDSHPIFRYPALLNLCTSPSSSSTSLSSPAPRRACVCVCFIHFTPSLTWLAHSLLRLPPWASPHRYPSTSPIHLVSNHPWRGNSICTLCFISAQIQIYFMLAAFN